MPKGQSASYDERVAKLDEKLAYHQKHIDILKEKKKKLESSKDKIAFNTVIEAMKASGKTPEEILALLNGTQEESA